MIDIYYEIRNLVDYAVRKGLIEEEDRIYATNAVLEVLGEDSYIKCEKESVDEPVEDILGRIRTWAVENNKVENDANEFLDLLDTRIMGVFIARPSVFRKEFNRHYKQSPKKATEFYYDFAKNANYIRQQRVAKDIRWTYDTPYGPLDMTINLSKPEKDPRAIALASRGVVEGQEKYPKCLLCKENEGYAGRIDHPARQNHRIVPLALNNEEWYMQYSPYVYYNEHCIVFKGSHDPMKITRETIQRLLDFVALFPHYMIGSNADLPIVGGSILTHDHFQGGNYDFAMGKAKEYDEITVQGSGIEMVKLHWPMSVIRLKSDSIEKLVEASGKIIRQWKDYSDENVKVRSHTGEEEHNTITPIVRFRDGQYEVDHILRNNRKDEDHPSGIFHSHEKYHHIKRENIGLIECLGLAVLPSRLRNEMSDLKEKLIVHDLEGIYADETLNKHGDFAKRILEENQSIDSTNALDILYQEIGKVFMNVLENCGVFKKDEDGEKAFQKCFEVMYECIKA
ncbi:UDP-glucose--hexose-1-phosphate uridylyltransferase [Proteiniclasticum sp. C24MP]|uniref:UDP-glucose--hexose-1-phosphate uridylyltransferase n=1 Tax=Proteiniclasticum sp. C24MP TaxID=3374101 RepID=UPI0037553E37